MAYYWFVSLINRFRMGSVCLPTFEVKERHRVFFLVSEGIGYGLTTTATVSSRVNFD